jgi:hypothetical protein
MEDNLQSIALQGHEGTIGECNACHESVPKTANKGPHGMHSIGEYWVLAHGKEAKKDSRACQACHGVDYKGTLLSEAFSKREYNTIKLGHKTIKAKQQVSCFTCHEGPEGPKKQSENSTK